jgi:hypothetical protein
MGRSRTKPVSVSVSVSVLGGEIPLIRIVIVIVIVIDEPRVGRERVLVGVVDGILRVFIGLSGLSGFGDLSIFSILRVEGREIIPRLREGIIESGPALVVRGFIDVGVGCGDRRGSRDGEGPGIATETHTLHASTSASGDCVEEELVGASAAVGVVVGW